jgi:molybdopterin synthase sulfur carrier subunit
MKIQVKLFASLAQRETKRIPGKVLAGQAIPVELPAKSRVEELLRHLELPNEEVKVVFVNGRARSGNHPLADGDQVGIFPLVGGG